MIKRFSIPLTALLASILTAVACCFLCNGGNSTAHFDFQKVYNDSPLKKKLESDLERVVSSRKSQLDSLNLELSLLSNKIDAKQASAYEVGNFETMKEQFLSRQSMYEEENMRLKQEYYDQISKDIYEKARMFCEKNGYDYLLSNGDETLVYGAGSKDVTTEFQKFLGK